MRMRIDAYKLLQTKRSRAQPSTLNSSLGEPSPQPSAHTCGSRGLPNRDPCLHNCHARAQSAASEASLRSCSPAETGQISEELSILQGILALSSGLGTAGLMETAIPIRRTVTDNLPSWEDERTYA